MKMLCSVAIICFFAFSCTKKETPDPITPPDTTHPTDTEVHLAIRGADLSFLPEIEAAGTTFYDSTGAKPALDIFKEYGCNLVRVRLWYQPADTHSSLPEVLAFCKKINNAGLKILLDLHYSDTWADPSHQSTPAAWAGLDMATLKDSVKAYTQRVMSLLKTQNTMPYMVQVGNEINAGMLWNLGKVNNASDPNWANFAALVKSGIAGVKAVDTDNKVLIMLHYAQVDGAVDFYTNMKAQDVNYDVQGLSYYPWWASSDLNYIQQQFDALATKFNKKILITETAYAWTLQWEDYTNNMIGEQSQLLTAFPATPQGQLNFLLQLKKMIGKIPGSLGMGFCYWEPDWVAFKGPTATDGSNYENLTLFDFENKALMGMRAYKE